MDLTLFWSVFVGLGIVYFAVAIFASRKVATEDEYFLAGRRFGIFQVTFTLVALQLGAGMVLGTSEEAYRYGYYGLLYNLGIFLGFVALGCGFASKLRELNISTTAELFEVKYGSLFLRRCASILSVLTLGGILTGQIVASRILVATFTTEHSWLLTGFWLLVIFYTMFGGLRAVVATDIFQVIVIFIVFALVFGYIVKFQEPLSLTSVDTWLSIQKEHFVAENLSFSRVVRLMLLPVFFALIEQDLAQRFFSAKTKTVAVVSAFLAGIIIVLFSLIPIYFGMKAKMLGLDVPMGASPLLKVVSVLAGDVALVFVVCALIAAISSTADSLLCAISSNIVYDFQVATLKSPQSYAMAVSRGVTLVVGLSALVTAYYFESILEVITQSYELSVSCLFVPLFFCFFKQRVHKESAAAAFMVGLLGFILFRKYPIFMPKELATLILSFLSYVVVDRWMYYQTRHLPR